MMKKQIQKKAKETFKKLKFKEETHTYTVDGKKIPSTSSLIKQFYEPFDAERVSFSMSRGNIGKQKALLAKWAAKRDLAASNGTEVHDFAENYVKNGFHYQEKELETNTLQKKAVIQFWRDLDPHLVPVFTEVQMYHLKHMYAGTSDFGLWDTKTGELIPCDYKTNEDLFKSYGNYMLSPFDLLEDTSYNHYQIQLSYYQILLEQLKWNISKRLLVWLKHDGTYELFYTTDYTKVLKKHLEDDKWRINTEDTKHIF